MVWQDPTGGVPVSRLNEQTMRGEALSDVLTRPERRASTMEVDLDLLADLLGAYEDFDHHDPPDFPKSPGVLTGEEGAPIAVGQLRPADKVLMERAGESDSDQPAEEARERELKAVYHHVGLLVSAECLTSQGDFYEEVPALESPGGHDVHVLTMKGHQLLDRLRDESEGSGDIGFATS